MATNVMHGSNETGVSIQVENGQELSSRNSKDIPHRYSRPEISPDEVSIDESSQIPVIDMSKLAADDNVGYQTEMAKLHHACKDWGFFQLTNHGATAAIEKMEMDTQELFKLPLEEKLVYAQLPNSPEGYGQSIVVSEDQKPDWNDMLLIYPNPVTKTRNMKFQPINPTSFRSSLEGFSVELNKICISLFGLMIGNLRVKFEEFVEMYEECTQAVRMNYFPPCLEAEKLIGVPPHSDASALTLLVEVNDVEGLQIKKNGKWIPIKPIPGAITVNIGDAMEIMSNGEYRSIEHRVLVHFQKERLSIAAFHFPSPKATISPLYDLVEENGAKYKAVKFEDYLNEYFCSTLNGKSMLDHVRIYN